ncbi:hypothetical protein [Cryobacterium zhongshanensis]|uniref:Uncharacterized protein n=1 Tax=Cryobacterium zhongshanensis TaxID=2928153 RepID=A0AA41UGU3_9MICO|nr:hypothetical protein [Cryobacterium zhongshanensis]MCI4659557.1 hypothetical protein [Cryobacterium zhongshanensis]
MALSPFEGMSLTELRSRASEERVERAEHVAELVAPVLVASPRVDTLSPSAEAGVAVAGSSFDAVVFAEGYATSKEASWAVEMSEAREILDDESTRPRRSTIRLVLYVVAIVVVPLLAGFLIYLGLLWTTPGISTPPDWLPHELWFPPFPLPSTR